MFNFIMITNHYIPIKFLSIICYYNEIFVSIILHKGLKIAQLIQFGSIDILAQSLYVGALGVM